MLNFKLETAMKFNLKFTIAFCIFALASHSMLSAQRPNQQRGGQRGGGGQRGERSQGGQGARGQTPPLLRVFDTDGDNELSPDEIDAAAQALRKLDRNKDGRLTAEELRPQQRGQFGGGRGQAQQGGGRGQAQGRPQQQGGPGGRGQQGGGRGQQGGGQGGGRRGDPAQADARFAAQISELDANRDNLISQSEIPQHMHDAFAIADADKSGGLDKKELLVLAGEFRRNRLSPDGEAVEMKNRPTQGAPNNRRQ